MTGASALTAFALFAAALVLPAAGCPYLGGYDLTQQPSDAPQVPDGHPPVPAHLCRRLGWDASKVPGKIVDATAADTGGLMPDTFPGKMQGIADLAKSRNEDMCYWSMQTLPAPPNKGEDGDWTVKTADLDGISELAEQATARMQANIKQDGEVVFAGCAYGWRVAQRECKDGKRTPLSCTDPVKNQKVEWPVASNIFNFSASGTKDAVLKMLTDWRTTQDGHLPSMESTYVKSGWGFGGQIISKVAPCRHIPDRFKYQKPFTCDTVREGQSVSLMDDALAVWKSLCNHYQHETWSANGGACEGDPALPNEPETTAPELTKPAISAVVDARNDLVRVTLTGPADRWFAVGLGGTSMMSAPPTIVVAADGSIEERKLAYHDAGEATATQVEVESTAVDAEAGTRTVTLTRAVKGASDKHFSFPASGGVVDYIWAIAPSAAAKFGQGASHSVVSRGAGKLGVIGLRGGAPATPITTPTTPNTAISSTTPTMIPSSPAASTVPSAAGASAAGTATPLLALLTAAASAALAAIAALE